MEEKDQNLIIAYANSQISQIQSGLLNAQQQYQIANHAVNDKNKRPDKVINVPVFNKDGDQTGVEPKTVYLNRITLPYQKLIVKRRVFFENLKDVKIYSQTDENSSLVEKVKDIREDVKYSFKIKEISKRVKSELQAGELWYKVGDEYKLKVISPALGYFSIPVFNEYGDMTHFVISYEVKDIAGNTVQRMDIYDQTNITRFVNGAYEKVEAHGFKKIPIIYYAIPTVEWADVQPIIERLETLVSTFADVIDYNGSPLTIIKGDLMTFANKGEAGKNIVIEKDADVKYLTWDQEPEAIKLEITNLVDYIYMFSNTPDMSAKEMRGLGVSGEAFDRIFLDAQLAAQDNLDGYLGEGMQRSVNLLVSEFNTKEKLTVECNAYRFNSLKEIVDIISKASGGETIAPIELLVKMFATEMGYDANKIWDQYRNERDLMIEEEEV